MTKKPIVILSGPTASGKSNLALEVAQKIKATIINCDSKQIYKEIPIITAQPSLNEMKEIEHLLYGVVSAKEDFSVASWIELAQEAINHVHLEEKIPMLVGGSGMYIKSLIHGVSIIPQINDNIRKQTRNFVQENSAKELHKKLEKIDPVMARRLNENDGQRVARAYEVFKQTGKSLAWWQDQKPETIYNPEQFLHFFLSPERNVVYENCNTRFNKMIENGVLEEIERLNKMNLDKNLPSMKSHGVPEIINYINGTMSLEEAIEQAQKNTRHYIKRQFTWFRGQTPDATELNEAAKAKMLAKIKNKLQLN